MVEVKPLHAFEQKHLSLIANSCCYDFTRDKNKKQVECRKLLNSGRENTRLKMNSKNIYVCVFQVAPETVRKHKLDLNKITKLEQNLKNEKKIIRFCVN